MQGSNKSQEFGILNIEWSRMHVNRSQQQRYTKENLVLKCIKNFTDSTHQMQNNSRLNLMATKRVDPVYEINI